VSQAIETLTERLEELESQLAFHDELIDSLNSTVARQDKEILELKHQFTRLFERLKEMGEAGAVPQDETPPHY